MIGAILFEIEALKVNHFVKNGLLGRNVFFLADFISGQFQGKNMVKSDFLDFFRENKLSFGSIF